MKISIKNISLWIIIVGILLRFSEYIANRSLWLDEAVIAQKISENSIFSLINGKNAAGSLAYPAGFLIFEKIALLFSNHEYALRFYPFVCGLLSLWLFYNVARAFFCGRYFLIALALFAVSPMAIYYASEAKPYSSDLLVTLILYRFFLDFPLEGRQVRWLVKFCLVCFLSVWFSYAATFVIIGVGVGLLLQNIWQKRQQDIRGLMIVLASFVLSFSIYYAYSLKTFSGNLALVEVWRSAFLESNILSVSFWETLRNIFALFLKMLFNYPLYFSCIVIFGFLGLWIGKKINFFVAVLPVIMTLMASALRIYPFQGRLVLFLVPSFIFLFVAGIEFILPANEKLPIKIAGILLGIVFIFPSLPVDVRQFNNPFGIEEIKPVLAYISKNREKDDMIYVWGSSLPAFKYYAARYGFSGDDYFVGESLKGDRSKFVKDLNKLKAQGARRIWFIFTHIEPEEGRYCIGQLRKTAEEIDTYIVHIDPGCPPGYYLMDYSASGHLFFLK